MTLNTPYNVLCLGAGGHTAGMIEILRQMHQVGNIAVIDKDPAKKGQKISGAPVIGNDDFLADAVKDGWNGFIVTIGRLGLEKERGDIYERAISAGLSAVSARHPTAIISPSVVLGDGISLMPGCIVHAGANIAANTIVNSGAIVEHDCTIGRDCHIAPGAILLGNVSVGDGCFIGAGAVIHQGISIGNNSIVGAGAVVLENVEAGKTVIGIPAKPLSR